MITIEADWLSAFFRLAVIILELTGTLTILIGAALATALFAKRARIGDRAEAYSDFRSTLGRSILLGLEFLVAGDIVKSLVINPTLDDLIVLAGLVLVRTFLSISLGVEINGHWPWQDTQMARKSQVCRPRHGADRVAEFEDYYGGNVMLQRRDMLGSGVMLAAAMVLAESAAAQQHHMREMPAMDGMAVSMKDCIDLCFTSHRTCIETAGYAIKKQGAAADLIVMLTDCAELCQATANSMLRNSPLHRILCRACAEACDLCADACSQQAGDTQMAGCAQTCRKCAQSCRDMAASTH